MGYHVKVEELHTALASICAQIEQWQSQLKEAQSALQSAQETAFMKGNTGDNIRSYIAEVQIPLAEALQQMLQEFEMKLTLYVQGYAELDDSQSAELLSERLEHQQDLLQQELTQFQTLSGEFNDILASVSDIVPVNYPHTSELDELFSKLGTFSQELNTKVGEYEESHKTDSQSVDEMINTIQSIISSRSGVGMAASSYVPGSYVMNPAYGTLKGQMSVSKDYTTKNLEKCVEYDKKQIIDLLREDPEITEEQIKTVLESTENVLNKFSGEYSKELMQTAIEQGLKSAGFATASITKTIGEWAIRVGGTMGPVSENSFVMLDSQLAINGSKYKGEGLKIANGLKTASKFVGPAAALGTIVYGTYADVDAGKTVGEGIVHNAVVVGSGVAVTAVSSLLVSNPAGWMILLTGAAAVGVSMLVDYAYKKNWGGMQDKLDAAGGWLDDRFKDIGEAFSFT